MQYKCLRAVSIRAVLFSALAISPAATADPGDLDPSFADHGRQQSLPGRAGVSVDLLETTDILVVGYGVQMSFPRDWGVCAEGTTFLARVGDDGNLDSGFQVGGPGPIQTFAAVQQPDGKTVGVGREAVWYGSFGRCNGGMSPRLAAFRLQVDGSIDASFGVDGIFSLPTEENVLAHEAHSVMLEPDGRIVIGGVKKIAVGDAVEYRSIVLRLSKDGGLDTNFGAGGQFVGPSVDAGHATGLVRAAGGGYHFTASAGACTVIGITAAGAMESGFGIAGIASVATPGGPPAECNLLEVLPDGRLIVAGRSSERGFVARLLANGARDGSFNAEAATGASMGRVTAVAPLTSGGLLVAGTGRQGAVLARLDENGTTDSAFGDGGRTWIDLDSDSLVAPVILDMAVREDGRTIAAGAGYGTGSAFVVRLLGDAGGASPGIVGFAGPESAPTEADGQAELQVRRSGGGDGEATVTYRTVAEGDAAAGEDYASAEGTLHWADGDRSTRSIVVDIAPDAGTPEGPEHFAVELVDLQGESGFGVRKASVTIQADGYPAGQLSIAHGSGAYEESFFQFEVWREHDFDGDVCVEVIPRSGTAIAGSDFVADSQTVCWGDQEGDVKYVDIPIIGDSLHEENETFSVGLANATGGAIITQASVAVIIYDNDDDVVVDGTPPPRGGGGSAGPAELAALLGLFLLSCASAAIKSRRET